MSAATAEPMMHLRAPAHAWYALAVLVVGTLFAFVDRQILVLVVEPLKHDLKLTDVEIGTLQGLGFALFSVCASLPLAWLADRLERAWVLSACVLVWSLATAACGFAHSFASLFVCTVGVAIGEAALPPIVYSFIPDLFPGRGRIQANIIFYGANVLGVGLGLALSAEMLGLVDSMRPVLLPSLRALASWRLLFILLAIPGPVIAFATALIGRTPREAVTVGNQVNTAGAQRLLAYFRAHGGTAALVYLATGFAFIAAFAFYAWLPAAFIRLFRVSPQAVGASFGFAYSTGSGIGLVLAAATTTLWRRWGGSAGPLRALSVTSALAIIPTLLVGAAMHPWQAYFAEGAIMALVTVGGIWVPSMLQNIAPANLRARVIALSTIVYMLIGGIGPIAVGMLSDRLGGDPRMLLIATLIVMVIGFALAAATYRAGETRFRKTVLALERVYDY